MAAGQHSEKAVEGLVALEATAREREAEGRHEEAAAAWQMLAAERRGRERAQAWAEHARLLAGPLGREPEALASWRRALTNDPAHRAALDALVERAATVENWPLLVNLQRRRFELSAEVERRVDIALALGRIELRELSNPGAARSWFEAALALAPDHAAIHEALADLQRERGDAALLLASLERAIELRGEETSPALLLEAAGLRADRGDRTHALSYLERATRRAPDDSLVLEAMAEVLSDLDRTSDLADVLERRAALAADDPATQASALAELGELFEQRLFDPEAALDAYERAHAADPGAPGLEAALVRLRAKVEASGVAREPALPAAPPEPDDTGAALAAYEQEAQITTDRARLGLLVRDILAIHDRRGTPERALPWVHRWVVAAPEDVEALRALARLHDVPGRENELLATLDMLDARLPRAEQGRNRRRMGELYASRGRPEDAVRAFESALAADPSDVAALDGLCRVLRQLERLPDLVAAQWRLAQRLEPPRRAPCLDELSGLQQRIGDTAGAIDSLAALEREAGAPEDARERLDDLLERCGRHEELERRLAARIGEHDPGSAESVRLALRRARLLEDALQRPEAAAEVYREVLLHAPESPDARAGLERALRESIDGAGLAEFLREQSERASDPRVRDRSAFERAVLIEEVLEQPESAGALFRSLAREAGEEEIRRDASRRYERLLERDGDWEGLRGHLEERVGQGSDADDVLLHERLARLCADRLRDEEGELAHLERVAALDPDRADVWRMLVDRYEQRGDRTDDLIHALEAELESGVDAPRELTLHGRLAQLCVEVLDDPDRAAAHYERVFDLDPSHSIAAQFLVERFERRGRPQDMVRVLEARLAALADPSEESRSTRTSLRLQIAHARETRLDDLEGAISALEVALGEAGPTAAVAGPLATCYQRAGYTLDLIDLCQAAASACGVPAERANWFVRLGDAFLAREQLREAADAYRQALTDRPDDRAVQASLREIYRQQGDAKPLARLLEAELAHLAGPDEIPVRLELVELLAQTLERPEDALIHARRILQLDADHCTAFDRAVSLSERLGRPEEALALIDTATRRAARRVERAALLALRARLLAGPLARADEAAEAYRRALELDPAQRVLRLELVELLERHERWEELLACLQDQACEVEGDARAALLMRGAGIATDRLGLEAALPWLERLRAVRPDDPSVPARIAAAHKAAGRHEARLRALGDELTLVADPQRRREIWLERAALLEQELRAPGRALAVLEQARAESPTDPEILRPLERLQALLGHDRERADTLEALLATAEGEDAVGLHTRLAELWGGPLADAAGAVRHWRAALDGTQPGSARHIEMLRALADTCRSAGWLERWAEHAEQELAALGRGPVFDDRRRELHRELALCYDGDLSRPDDALRHLRALLDAGDAELLGSEVLDVLEETCLRVLRAQGDPVELAARLARHLQRRPQAAERWLELARLRDEPLQASRAALDAYRRTLELDPTCLAALRGLRATADRLGRWSDVADALELELEHPELGDGAERSALLRRLGDVCWHRLQSTTRASRCYAAALEVNGADFASLRALERLLESMEDWRGALDLYESEVEVLGDDDPERRREIWLHVASLAHERTDDVERARAAYAEAAALAPLETAHRARLAELHEAAEDREAFAEEFARWCDAPDSSAGCADHVRLAESLEALGRLDEAVARIERALEADATHAGAWDAAARLREGVGDARASADALERAAGLVPDHEAASRLLDAAGRLSRLEDERALALLREAAERDPRSLPVHAELARLAARLDEAEQAEAAAAHALELAGEQTDPELRVEIARLGGDAARKRGRLETAAGFYARACEAAPDDAYGIGAHAETLMALGDTGGARRALEARLALPGDSGRPSERARQRALLGRCLEREGELEEALSSFEQALVEDPRQPDALESMVRVHEALDHVDAGIAALERWARAAGDRAAEAERLLRAARWEMRTGDRDASAERHLREALRADASLVPAWIARVELLSANDRLEEAIEVADRAARHVVDDADLATLALLQARAYEQRGARRDAAEAFGVAAEADPTCCEAALSGARLLRGAGEWRRAAETLERFVAVHDPEDAELAEVHEQLGRLRAGPLEDVDGAVVSYRHALALDPSRQAARASLAELLSHRAGDWEEALDHHRALLDADPTDVGSLRVALRIARGRENAAAVAEGVRILRALGVASAYERDEGEAPNRPADAAEGVLEDPRFEKMRLVTRAVARQLGEALEAPGDRRGDPPPPDTEAGFRAEALAAEGRLTAPALLPLPPREVGEVLTLLATLALDPEQVHGDGRLVNALSTALGRRPRRKLRRLLEGESLEALRAIDFERWRVEVRALAAAEVLRTGRAPLRTALVALVRESADAPDADLRDGADLTTRVAADPVARALLRRLLRGWLERIA